MISSGLGRIIVSLPAQNVDFIYELSEINDSNI